MPELTHLGRYEIVREIGRGAMGVVYLANDPVIGRTLAIKTITLPEGLDGERREEYYRRFLQEARTAGGLTGPGIVTVFDAGLDAETGRHYLAMEYVPGRSLKEALEHGPLPEEEVLRVGRRIAEALAEAHDRGIIHRDLKPANILLGDDGSVKIADFGIARVEGSDLTREGQSLGSPAYMSPEQVHGREVDRRSDLFSLGVVLYEALTGERPFAGKDALGVAYQVVHARPQSLRRHDENLWDGWQPILDRLLAKRPEARHEDARALARDFDFLETEPGPPPARRRPIPLPSIAALAGAAWRRARTARRAPFLAAGLLGLVVVSAVLASLALGPRTPVTVDFMHGLEDGRLRVLMDGSEVVDRSFSGKAERGHGPFSRRNQGFEIPLQLPPGEHEFVVQVESPAAEREWSASIRRRVPEEGEARLEVRVQTKFLPGMRLDWELEEVSG